MPVICSVRAWNGRVLVGLTEVVATVWGSLVLYYLAPGPDWARIGVAAIFLVVGLVDFAGAWLRRNRRAAAISYAMAFGWGAESLGQRHAGQRS